MEKYLKQSGHNVELINMGIPSIGPKEYLSLLVNEGFALEPDRVLLSFTIGSAFSGQPTKEIHRLFLRGILDQYVLERWRKFEGPISVGQKDRCVGTYDDNAPTFTDDAYLALELKRGIIFVRNNGHLRLGFRPFEERFAEAMSYISEIKRLCDSRNISLTIVLIPDEMQVSKPLQTRVIVASGLAPASFDFTLPNRLLHASFEELKIDYTDLTTEFSSPLAQR